MQKSDSIKELATALAKAQAEIKAAAKSSENPFFKSKYADLSAVWEACKAPLSKHGLSISQHPGAMNGEVTVETVLMHASGEWIASTLAMRPTKGDPQSFGSAVTYARRYALAAVVGVVTDDDDGNAASGDHGGSRNGHTPAPAKAEPKPEAKSPKVRLSDAIAKFSGVDAKDPTFRGIAAKIINVASEGAIKAPMTDDEAAVVLAFVDDCRKANLAFESVYAGEVRP